MLSRKLKMVASLVLAFCLCLAMAMPALAAETDIYTHQQTLISVMPVTSNEITLNYENEIDADMENSQTSSFIIPISSPDNIYSIPIGYIENESNERANDVTLVWATLVRKNFLQQVDVIINWTGTDFYNSWKFSKCIIDNAEFIRPVIYGQYLAWIKNVSGARQGTVTVGSVTIPDNVAEARVVFSNLAGYDMNKGMWRSVTIVPKLGEIQ